MTEINAHGGEMKTFQVDGRSGRAGESVGLSMTDLFNALKSNNANVGGGYLVHNGEARYIRGVSQARNVEDIAAIVIDERNGVPVTVGDVAKVGPAPMIRAGLATRDGQGEIVTGLVMMLIGQNGREVVERVKTEIEQLQKSMPAGVTIEPLYDRTHLIDQTLNTVLHNLTAGGVLVMIVLLLLLGNLRGGLIVALAIPLSMLFAANVMLATGISASLMSLGAIDFGLMVDSSVIMIENCVRRLAHEGGTRPKFEIVRDAAVEVRKPTMFGELIIMIVYLPILALQGTEGKLFRPMALTVIFALLGSLVLSLTLMPVLAAMGLSARPREKELWLIRWLKHALSADPRRVHPPPDRGIPAGPGAGRRQRADRPEPGRRVHAPAQRGGPPHRGGPHPVGLARGGRAGVDPDRKPAQDDPRGAAGLLQDRPARDRQRRHGRAPDRRLDHAQTAARVATGPDPRRSDQGDG